MNLSENDHDLIQKYLLGTASNSEKKLMDSRLIDMNFRKELTHQAQLMDALVVADEELVREELQRGVGSDPNTSATSNDQNADNKGTTGIKALSIAAGILLLGAALWFLLQNTSVSSPNYPQMAAAEFTAFPVDGPQRGSTYTLEAAYSQATTAYANEQYGEALPLLLSLDPQDESIQLYIASSHMGLKDYASANQIFSKLALSQDFNISQNAQWYMALCELGMNNPTRAKQTITQISQNNTHLFQNKAKQLLLVME